MQPVNNRFTNSYDESPHAQCRIDLRSEPRPIYESMIQGDVIVDIIDNGDGTSTIAAVINNDTMVFYSSNDERFYDVCFDLDTSTKAWGNVGMQKNRENLKLYPDIIYHTASIIRTSHGYPWMGRFCDMAQPHRRR